MEKLSEELNHIRINPRYDMRLKDLHKIHDAYVKDKDLFEVILYCFKFGYEKGQRQKINEYKRIRRSPPLQLSTF